MKNISLKIKAASLIILSSITFACEDYLDKSELSEITDKDVFGDFVSFQSFIELMYADIVPLQQHRDGTHWNYGDDIIGASPNSAIEDGDYRAVLGGRNYPFNKGGETNRSFNKPGGEVRVSYWDNGWAGIRTANLALDKLDLLVNGTQEERDLIAGQAYFFRAYFHWEIMKAWGAVPYVDVQLAPDSDLKIPVLTFQETAEKVVADLEMAAQLLPDNWDNTDAGGATEGANIGRITRGIAQGIMAEVLLFSGSPLMNGVSNNSYTYNKDYMERAAEAAWEVIQLADQGVYSLQPWESYSDIFYRDDRTIPIGPEIIFRVPHRGYSRYKVAMMQFSSVGGDGIFGSPTQNYVELFEMDNGLPIDDPASGYDPMDPWSNRDPRFDYNIVIDDERIVQSVDDERAFAQLHVGGRDRGPNASRTGYGYEKYLCNTCNNLDNWAGSSRNYNFIVHRLRLAEIYLFYAEAVNEAYGPNGSHPGAGLTAVEALNIVRNRANMPGVNAKFTSSTEVLRERVWVERAVELAYEGKRWYDIRRWYVAHLPEYKEMYGLEFDEAHTYFRKALVKTRIFDMKHYWLPFPTDQVNLYEGWSQNPGW